MSSRFKVKVPVGKISRTMQRDHLDVLQNIEFALVSERRANPAVDDAAVREALVAMLNWRQAGDPLAATVLARLSEHRQIRPDVTDEVWRDGLRVVLDSVKNHSECRPGETAYLDFAGMFLP